MSPTLPPVPDASGDPRPPAGPVIAGGTPPKARSTHYPGARHSTGHAAYVGGSAAYPMLERVALLRPPTVGRVLRVAALGVAVPVAVLVVGLLVIGPTVAVPGAIIVGAMFLWFAANALVDGDAPIIEVGARGITDRRSSDVADAPVVDLYLLAEVTIREEDTGPVLVLVQPTAGPAGSVGVVVPCALLEANPELWALVYNGVRHSEAAGASIDARSRELLHLPALTTGTDREEH